MGKELKCPECGHDKFICKALISATVKTVYDDDGELDFVLEEWDYVESIEYFDCGKCGFAFQGDEDKFREFLQSNSNTQLS